MESIKRLLVVIVLVFSGIICFSQSNDTVYFKSGHVIPCTIFAYNDSTVVIEYKNHRDEKITEIISISLLKSFVDLNDFNEQLFKYVDENNANYSPIDTLGLDKSRPKFNDTLFYKSGMEKICEVITYDGKNVEYRYINSRGNEVVSIISKDQLKYFNTYDSLGVLQFSSLGTFTNSAVSLYTLPDSLEVSSNQFSISPYSMLILGIDNTFRFGKKQQLGFHILNQIFLVALYNGGNFLSYHSIGLNFYLVNKPKSSMLIGFNGVIVYAGGDGVVAAGFPVSIGFVRNLRPKLALDGYIGLGPGIEIPVMPIAHFGITFLFGKKVKIAADKSYY